MSLVITDAGIAASINAQTLGVEYKITHIAIGLEGYLPTVDQTELKQEFIRKPLSRGAIIAPGQLHFEAVFDDNSAFEGKEIGYFLEDGTLFAVDSRDGEILSLKRSNTIITEAFELNLAGSEISNITVEIMGTPYATETVAGIAKIATEAEVAAGVDDEKIVTAKKLKLVAYPVGSPIPWPSDVLPVEGYWAFMKGQEFDTETYKTLANIYTNGILPDMRELAIVGKGDNDIILAYEADGVKSHTHNITVSNKDLGSKSTSSDSHTHSRGSMEITGRVSELAAQGGAGKYGITSSGAFYKTGGNGEFGLPDSQTTEAQKLNDSNILDFKASRAWSGTTSSDSHVHSVVIGSHNHAATASPFGNNHNTIRNRKFNYIVRLA